MFDKQAGFLSRCKLFRSLLCPCEDQKNCFHFRALKRAYSRYEFLLFAFCARIRKSTISPFHTTLKKTLEVWENVSSIRNLTDVPSCERIPLLESDRCPWWTIERLFCPEVRTSDKSSANGRFHAGPMTIDRVKGSTVYCSMSQASSEILSQALRVFFQRRVGMAKVNFPGWESVFSWLAHSSPDDFIQQKQSLCKFEDEECFFLLYLQ